MSKNRKQGQRLTVDSMQAMGMLAPMMIGFVLFTYVPIIYILRYSLYESNGFKEKWIGLDNYVKALQDPGFLHAFCLPGDYQPAGFCRGLCPDPGHQGLQSVPRRVLHAQPDWRHCAGLYLVHHF